MRTPLYQEHIKAGGRIIDFGGWELPVQYSGIIEEHKRVRSNAGLFDVSHMGEIMITGDKAGEFVQKIVTNEILSAKPGRVVYSPMCRPDGGTVDDLLVYIIDSKKYLIVVNAANISKDYEWMLENKLPGADIKNLSEEYAQLAVQGPSAQKVLEKLTKDSLDAIGFFKFAENIDLAGMKVLISRTGYTGEDGFEVYLPAEKAALLWNAILEAGNEYELKPIGLGARDTLRFEAALPLYGHELSDSTSPLEAGLDKFVKLTKQDFIGKSALDLQKEKGLKSRLVGLEMIDRGVPRNGYEVHAGGKLIGKVTSGSFAPTLEKNLAMALIDYSFCTPGTEVDMIIRNTPLKAKVVELPFYTKKYKK